MVVPLMKNKLSIEGVIHEYMYSIGSVVFHFIEIYEIVFIADAIEKEVFICLLYNLFRYF